MQLFLSLLFFGYCFSSLSGFAAEMWWVFDLFTHFRFQYFWIGFLLLPLFTWYKKTVMAFLIGVLMLFNGTFITNVLFSEPLAVFKPAQTVRVMSTNIQFNHVDIPKAVKSINQANPDVVFLYEIQPLDLEKLIKEVDQFPYVFTQPAFGALDVTVLAKKDVVLNASAEFTNIVFPVVEAQVAINEKESVTVVGIHPYPPISDKTTEIRDSYLEAVLKKYGSQDKAVVVVGDFNITSFSPKFTHWLKEYYWIDTQVEFGLQPSWPVALPAFMRVPIDHALVSPQVEVYNRWLGNDTGSDHLPVLIDIGLK